MTKIITAVCENGVLRPLDAVPLPEGSILKLQVLTEDPIPASPKTVPVKQYSPGIQALIDAGVITPPRHRHGIKSVSEEARRELADRLGQRPGKPLSEIIIEDRGPL